VLLSSHLLREIEVIADHIVVIGGGRILTDGSRQELLAGVEGGLEELFLRLAAIALATPIVIVVMLFVAAPQNLTYNKLVDYTQTPQKLLLPALGILVIMCCPRCGACCSAQPPASRTSHPGST
jgi:hypothetical protein